MEAPILKSKEEIEAMRPAGRIVAKTLKLLREMVVPGVTTLELDQAAEDLIRKNGAIPAFKGYPNFKPGVIDFPGTICASVNEEVVHGIPCDRVLCKGDIISIDVGANYDGWFGDAARTYAVGEISRKAAKLLSVTEESLNRAVARLKDGVDLGWISAAVQEHAEENGFSVVRDFVGHGIGREMHEPPQIPNFVNKVFRKSGVEIKAGAVLAIEPMVNMGGSAVRVGNDGWVVTTKDRSLSAHFENTVAVTADGVIVLTEE